MQFKCSSCGKVKDASEFGSNRTSSTGFQTYCRTCKNANRAERMKENMDLRLRHHFHTRMVATMPQVPEDLYANMEKYLGYRMKELIRALDKQCREDFGFNLRKAVGVHLFHVDHRTPLVSFGVETADSEAFRACWAISNLKAIPAAENLSKGSKTIA